MSRILLGCCRGRECKLFDTSVFVCVSIPGFGRCTKHHLSIHLILIGRSSNTASTPPSCKLHAAPKRDAIALVRFLNAIAVAFAHMVAADLNNLHVSTPAPRFIFQLFDNGSLGMLTKIRFWGSV